MWAEVLGSRYQGAPPKHWATGVVFLGQDWGKLVLPTARDLDLTFLSRIFYVLLSKSPHYSERIISHMCSMNE